MTDQQSKIKPTTISLNQKPKQNNTKSGSSKPRKTQQSKKVEHKSSNKKDQSAKSMSNPSSKNNSKKQAQPQSQNQDQTFQSQNTPSDNGSSNGNSNRSNNYSNNQSSSTNNNSNSSNNQNSSTNTTQPPSSNNTAPTNNNSGYTPSSQNQRTSSNAPSFSRNNQSPPTSNRSQTKPYSSPFSSNSPFGGFGNSQGSKFGKSPGTPSTANPKRKNPQERVEMIKKVYSEILGREPDTRDINYYKYSTLDEDQVRKQILNSSEHKDLVKKGKEYEKMKEQADQFKSRTKMLEAQIKDQLEEFKQLNILLKQKNRYINQLRQDIIRNREDSATTYIPQYALPISTTTPKKPEELRATAPSTNNNVSAQPQMDQTRPEPPPQSEQPRVQQIQEQPSQEAQDQPLANPAEQFDYNVAHLNDTTHETQQPRVDQSDSQQGEPTQTADNSQLENPGSPGNEPSLQQPENSTSENSQNTQQAPNNNQPQVQQPTNQPPPPPQIGQQFADETNYNYSKSSRKKAKHRVRETLNSIFGDIF